MSRWAVSMIVVGSLAASTAGAAEVGWRVTREITRSDGGADDYGLGIVAADVDCNGKDDLLIAGYDPSLPPGQQAVALAYLAEDGGFRETPVRFGSEIGASRASLLSIHAVGDVTGDGCEDVALHGETYDLPLKDGDFAVYASAAEGPTYAFSIGRIGLASGRKLSLAAGDYEHDGHQDLMVMWAAEGEGETPNYFETYYFRGSLTGVDPARGVLLEKEERWGSPQLSLHPFDLDGDGYPDAIAWGQDTGWAYYGGPDGLGARNETFDLSLRSYGGGSMGDLNGDGLQDFGQIGFTGQGRRTRALALYYGTSDGLDREPRTVFHPDATDGQLRTIVAPVDADGDAFGDVIASDDSSLLELLLYSGGPGGLQATPRLVSVSHAGFEARGGLSHPASLGDVNGDGFTDFAALSPGEAEYSSVVFVLLSQCADWYVDADGDGYGDPSSRQQSCVPVPDWVRREGDCDDADPQVHPGATEQLEDGVDQDCDGLELCFVDVDRDGFTPSGDPELIDDLECELPSDPALLDCDDAREDVNPGAAEVCDGRDNDCDGVKDPDSSVDVPDWGYDHDGDGFTTSAVRTACAPFTRMVLVTDPIDCDDGDPTVFPGAPETNGDGIDQDCDGEGQGGGCGCSTGGPAASWVLIGLLLTVARRRSNPSVRAGR